MTCSSIRRTQASAVLDLIQPPCLILFTFQDFVPTHSNPLILLPDFTRFYVYSKFTSFSIHTIGTQSVPISFPYPVREAAAGMRWCLGASQCCLRPTPKWSPWPPLECSTGCHMAQWGRVRIILQWYLYHLISSHIISRVYIYIYIDVQYDIQLFIGW